MRFVVRSRNDFLNIADRIEFTGKPLTVTVKKFHRPRTLDQNAKLHAMIRELAEHTGHTESELKDWVKVELGLLKVIEIGSNVVEVPVSSTEYTVQQCGDLIERIYQVGAEVGCVFSES